MKARNEEWLLRKKYDVKFYPQLVWHIKGRLSRKIKISAFKNEQSLFNLT